MKTALLTLSTTQAARRDFDLLGCLALLQIMGCFEGCEDDFVPSLAPKQGAWTTEQILLFTMIHYILCVYRQFGNE
eukprot:15326407-Ditylum_brightwellii.AAC.1